MSVLIHKVQKSVGSLSLVDVSKTNLGRYHDGCLGIGSTLPEMFNSESCSKTNLIMVTSDKPLQYPGVNDGCVPLNYELQKNKVGFYKSGSELIIVCHMNPKFRWTEKR